MAAASVHVRPAHHSDFGAVSPIVDDFMAQHHRWQPSRFRPTLIGFTPAVFQSWIAHPDELNLVAAIDSGVVGYTRASRFAGSSNEFILPRRGVHVGLLMVAPNARRNGAGRALFQSVENWANASGAEFIGLDMSPQNATARAFYAALGYDLVNEYRAKTLRQVRRFEADP